MKHLKQLMIICALPLVLTACGGSGNKPSPTPTPTPQPGKASITNLGITDRPSHTQGQ
jgi:hypothetical protein